MFLILVFIVIIIGAAFAYRHYGNIILRQCSYGCPKAYKILKNPKKYTALKDLFEILESPADRYFYSVCMSREMPLNTLEQWTKDFPESGDALLCYGARLLQWSWLARGYGRGGDVSESQWKEFFTRLDKTRQVLLRCTEKSPEDPTPWAYLIMIATWHSDSEALKYSYFNEATARDPSNWAAHMHMIIALSQKWGGCNDGMVEFARNAAQNAPLGSDLNAIVVKAYIEYWKYLYSFEDSPDDAREFILDDNIQRDIVEAYNNSLAHADFIESKVSIFVRYNLSGWFWMTRDRSRLRTEFLVLGNKIEDIHWRWVGSEGELSDAKSFANQN